MCADAVCRPFVDEAETRLDPALANAVAAIINGQPWQPWLPEPRHLSTSPHHALIAKTAQVTSPYRLPIRTKSPGVSALVGSVLPIESRVTTPSGVTIKVILLY